MLVNRRDGMRVQRLLEQTVENLKNEFSAERPSPLLTSASIDIYVHPRRNDVAREGLVSLQTGRANGGYVAKIDILTPSAHRPGSKTSVGEPMDDNYIFKNLVHEYSTIVLDRLTRQKKDGWRFFDAPDWFVQGYEEYLGLMLSSKHSRNITFEKYRALLRMDPSRVSREFVVKDAYLDGAVLVQFLHEIYTKEKVHSILQHDAEDFWSAMSRVTGHNRAEMYMAWTRWLKDRSTSAGVDHAG